MTPDWDDAEDWDDDRNPDLDDCIHEDADVDILTGEMTCNRCGFRKYLTDAALSTGTSEPMQIDEVLK